MRASRLNHTSNTIAYLLVDIETSRACHRLCTCVRSGGAVLLRVFFLKKCQLCRIRLEHGSCAASVTLRKLTTSLCLLLCSARVCVCACLLPPPPTPISLSLSLPPVSTPPPVKSHLPFFCSQGLCFEGGFLYESTGLFGGKSTVRKVDTETGNVVQMVKLGDKYFGEGMVIVENKVRVGCGRWVGG